MDATLRVRWLGGVPYDDADRVLRGLHEHGWRVIVFTTRHYLGVQRWLSRHGLFEYVNEITDEMIELLAKKAAERPSVRTFAPITFLMGGPINRVDPAATAYSGRSANYLLAIDGNWSDPAEDETVISWVRDTYAEFSPYGTGSGYLNFRSLADESEDSDVESSFGDNMRRLAPV